jgi:Mrp family chromosome partitioning ATPase
MAFKRDASTRMGRGPVIIPIASGKGGVGKSFLAANLAMALAQSGHRTIAADLDLGGSNLHSFLGLPNRHPGICDFIRKLAERIVKYWSVRVPDTAGLMIKHIYQHCKDLDRANLRGPGRSIGYAAASRPAPGVEGLGLPQAFI